MGGLNHVRSFLILVEVDIDAYIENQRQDQDDIDGALYRDRCPVNRA
jgi:hypothetical protein